MNEQASFDPDDEEWTEVVRLIREARQKSRGYAEYWEWSIDRSRVELDAACVLRNFLVAAGEKAPVHQMSCLRPWARPVLSDSKVLDGEE
jgi:hypothetical protein